MCYPRLNHLFKVKVNLVLNNFCAMNKLFFDVIKSNVNMFAYLPKDRYGRLALPYVLCLFTITKY